MITPHLSLKDIPMIAVNHTYEEIGMFPKQIVGGGCVIGGTKIKTDKGLVEIENLNVGDKVLTTEGYKTITHTWNPETLVEGNPECFEIEFEDGYKVTVSENHKFLTEEGWISVKDKIFDKNFISVL